MSGGLILAGIILFIYGIPNILPGGTVLVEGIPSDDIVMRLFSALFPLIATALGILLFRVKPYYPSSVMPTYQDPKKG
jgi:hypothetical protein